MCPDIWISISSEKRATAFLRTIERKLRLLSAHRMIGRARPELRPGLRSFPVPSLPAPVWTTRRWHSADPRCAWQPGFDDLFSDDFRMILYR